MAQKKITFNNKTNKAPVIDRDKQIVADDVNEIKVIVNDNSDDAEERINNLDIKVENLEENQSTGVEVYNNYTDLPNPGEDKVSYKVSNDTDSSLNGYYHWSGTAYVKDYDLASGNIEEGDVDAVSGDTVFKYLDINDVKQRIYWVDKTSEILDTDEFTDIESSIFKSIRDIWFSDNIKDIQNLSISINSITKNVNDINNDYKVIIVVLQNSIEISRYIFSNIVSDDIDDDVFVSQVKTLAGEDVECNLIINFKDAIDDGSGTLINTSNNDLLKIRQKSNSYYYEQIKYSKILADENKLLAPYVNKYFIADFDTFKIQSTDKIEAFKAVGDVWAVGLEESAYKDYEFSILYLGKDDSTYKDIFWMAYRATSNDAWVPEYISSDTDIYWSDGLNHKKHIWRDVEFNFIIYSEFIPTEFKTLTNVILSINDIPRTEVGKVYLETLKISDELGGESIISPNQSEDYLTSNPYKSSYYAGHNENTDIKKNQLPPSEALINTNATGVSSFLEDGVKYLQGNFKVDLRSKLQQYELDDQSTIYPLYLTSRVYNDHATESVNVKFGTRFKVDGVWVLPDNEIILSPKETKIIEYPMNIDNVFDWSQLNTDPFDYWIEIESNAPELDPAWIYFGDVDLYFYDEKQREIRPFVDPKTIKKGIELDQLSDSLQTKINSSNSKSVSKKSIALSGSSITWGNGFLDDRFAGSVDEMIKNELSTTLLSSSDSITYSQTPVIFSSVGVYKGEAHKLSSLNNKISFSLEGDELAICQVIERTSDYGLIRVKADGVTIGEFSNINNTLGSDTDSFVGNNNDVRFLLKHPYTYNHIVTVGGVVQDVVINTGGFGSVIPGDKDGMIIRAFDQDGNVKHMLWLKNAPASSASIGVTYDYGKVIYHELSTVGQLDSDTQTNESNYGFGDISFDPASPSSVASGMEFRSIDKRSFWVHKFTEVKLREFEIEIIGGVNPYFTLNYISNRFHNFMNAGIGGWKLQLLLNNDGINDYNDIFNEFIPEVIVTEFSTNDDWDFSSRRLSRTVTGLSELQVKELWTLELNRIEYQSGSNDYEVDFTTGIITSINKLSLISSDIIGSGVVVGDIVRIGNYYGDNKQVAVREITTVNTITGEITWNQPLNTSEILNINSLSDLVGKEISIRDLSGYMSLYEELITKLQSIASSSKILITNSGLSDYFLRQLWGYEIIHRKLSSQFNNVDIIEVTDWLYDYQQGNISGDNYESIIADGSTEYNLSQQKHWQGFEVIIDGVNVYGKDCYIESGWGYGIDPSLTGAAISVNGDYDRSYTVNKAMKLVFFKNAPASGVMTIKKADAVWSNDFTHTDINGGYVYGQIYTSKLKPHL